MDSSVGHFLGILPFGISGKIVDIDGFALEGLAEVLVAGGDGEMGHEEEQIDDCPGSSFEDEGQIGPHWARSRVDEDSSLRQ